MAARYRILLVSIIVVLLAACTEELRETEVAVIAEPVVVGEMAYWENGIGPITDESGYGPTYLVSFAVPESWIGVVEVRNEANRLVFEVIVDEFTRAPIFTVDALSEAQYWEQIGSYPGIYTNMKNSNDTYFTYRLPIDAYYSGLEPEEYEAFAAEVPAIVASFAFERVGPEFYGR